MNGSGRGAHEGPGNGSTPGPARITRIELHYGRHGRAFEIPADSSPFVIAGPNGSGKSTLVEGLVRTLYGFRRARREERETHERRRPWAGGPYRGRLWIETPKGAWSFERDFETDRVRVMAPGAEAPRFEGEANPTRAGESIRRYRALLEEAVGLSKLDDYRRTGCVFQGGLPATSLSVDLLRVAAGGHADVETALERLRSEYQDLTLEPIGEGASRRRTAGAVEKLEATISALESALREARAADEQRGPLVRDRDERQTRLAASATELETLERAFETLSETAHLEEVAEASRARVRRLESWTRELDEALARYDLARDRRDATSSPTFPPDFLERARALEAGLWPRRAALERETTELPGDDTPIEASVRASRASLAALLALVASGGLWLAGAGGAAGLALGLALAAAGLAVVSRRLGLRDRAERVRRREGLVHELAALDAEIAELLVGIADAAALSPATLSGARERFEREAGDRRIVEECERSLQAAIDHASRALTETWDEDRRASNADRVPGGLTERARDRLRLLHDAVAEEREETLAPLKLKLEEMRRVRLDLPGGVEPTVEGVRAARRACLAESDRLRSELATIERDLAVGARPEASALGLEEQLARTSDSLVAHRARARAYRAAYALIGEAYESFRRTDEERLLGAISTHLGSISDGALGALDASEGLDAAHLELDGRLAPIAAPPLSYGQLHAAWLAIRMGAADFLAGLGVRVPLLIDDPFVHLDERSAAELWGILERLAVERQVIVATQDRLVLDHLGVVPSLTLESGETAGSPGGEGNEADESRRERSVPREPDRGERPRPDLTSQPPSRLRATEDAPDLWSQLDD